MRAVDAASSTVAAACLYVCSSVMVGGQPRSARCRRPYAMTNHLTKLLVASVLFPGAASAENGCPPGQTHYSSAPSGTNASIRSCGPIPASSYEPAWSTRWGAIASDTQGAFGVVTGKRNKRGAESAAIKECKKHGGVDCNHDLSFRNQCASVVTSGSKSFIQSAETEQKAEANGLRRCHSYDPGSDCWVHVSVCSLPVRTR